MHLEVREDGKIMTDMRTAYKRLAAHCDGRSARLPWIRSLFEPFNLDGRGRSGQVLKALMVAGMHGERAFAFDDLTLLGPCYLNIESERFVGPQIGRFESAYGACVDLLAID